MVRDLYKRVLTVGRDYPLGLAYVRSRAKREFGVNAGLTQEEDIMRAIRRGRWQVKEMAAVVQLRKYRQLRNRYGDAREAVHPAEPSGQ